ncbi:MAG: tRNA (adenosine(37)-N6)-dimethylallyltransferase MiaA [Pseudomonadota bacterium]
MKVSRRFGATRAADGFCLIGGSTASGKSALAITLAEMTGGVVINADSVQLYRSLPILTAQPTTADRARVDHRLYGILDDTATGSVAIWLDLAVEAIRAVQPRLAIVTGGTGFYLEALLRGQPTTPATPPDLRAASRARLAELGEVAFAAELARLDPALAARGLPADPQRRLRAFEVITLTGRSILDWQAAPACPPDLPPFRGGIALVPPREVIWPRVRRRAEAMLAAGVLEEIAAWRVRCEAAASPLAKADGVVELGRYLDGHCSLETAVDALVVKVRRYAKRQRTWLRHRLPELTPSTLPGEAGSAVDILESIAGIRS